MFFIALLCIVYCWSESERDTVQLERIFWPFVRQNVWKNLQIPQTKNWIIWVVHRDSSWCTMIARPTSMCIDIFRYICNSNILHLVCAYLSIIYTSTLWTTIIFFLSNDSESFIQKNLQGSLNYNSKHCTIIGEIPQNNHCICILWCTQNRSFNDPWPITNTFPPTLSVSKPQTSSQWRTLSRCLKQRTLMAEQFPGKHQTIWDNWTMHQIYGECLGYFRYV